MNNRNTGLFALILANLIPVYGALMGELTFFQVLYLYWFESVLLIFFNGIKIVFAKGETYSNNNPTWINGVLVPPAPGKVTGILPRVGILLRFAIGRFLLLMFYLIFIIVFIGFIVTDKANYQKSFSVIFFLNPYFNSAVLGFVFSNIITLATSFFMNGSYKVMSPREYNSFVDVRTIIIHVMTIVVAFVHLYFFEGKSYAGIGEVIYIMLFMFIKTMVDIHMYNSEIKKGDDSVGPAYI